MFHGFPCLQWKGVGGVSHGWVQGFVPLALIQFAVKYLLFEFLRSPTRRITSILVYLMQ